MPTRQSKKMTKRKRMPKVIDLKIAGASERQIAAQLGVSQKTVYNDVREWLGRLAEDSRVASDSLRDLYTTRYERMLMAIWPDVVNGDREAVDSARRILYNLSQIWGLITREPVINLNQFNIGSDDGRDPRDILLARIDQILERTGEGDGPPVIDGRSSNGAAPQLEGMGET